MSQELVRALRPLAEKELTMGLIDFAKSVGRKLGLGDEEPAHPKAAAAPPSGGPTPEQVKDVMDRRRAGALVKLVNDMGFHVEDLGVRADGDKVTLTGKADTQENREKIVLLVGNVEGVGQVDDRLTVETPQPEAVFYEVKAGDNLSKIAKHFYGNANKYPQIFEANKPMLKDPDEIYPGQRLRIPGPTQAQA
jgi:nucleoid-associated protein YgaU